MRMTKYTLSFFSTTFFFFIVLTTTTTLSSCFKIKIIHFVEPSNIDLNEAHCTRRDIYTALRISVYVSISVIQVILSKDITICTIKFNALLASYTVAPVHNRHQRALCRIIATENVNCSHG